MIAFASTAKQLRERLDSFINVAGEDAFIGIAYSDGSLDGLVQLELVYVDKDGNIVGDEAEDYKTEG